MKRYVFILFSFVSILSSNATNCVGRYFIENNIVLYVCHNYGRGAEEAAIYYDGAIKALNDYIQLKKDRGELKNKQFHIQMYSSILSQPHYHLSQSNNNYYMMAGRHLELMELIALINKFSEPDFTSLDIGLSVFYDQTVEESEEERQKRWEKVLSDFEMNEKKLLERDTPSEDMYNILNKEYITWQKGAMKFVYSNNRVKSFLKDKEIEHHPIGYPSTIRDRYILQECGFFKVYDEDANLLKTLKNKDDTSYCDYSFNVAVYDRWVNFMCDGYDEVRYSYSYDRNRFYVLESEK